MRPSTVPLKEGYALSVIGDFVIFGEDVDPRQSWLPFVHGVVVKRVDPPPAPHPHMPKKRVACSGKRIALGSRFREDARYLHMYEHLPGVDQYPLPFFEFRRIPKKEWGRITQAGFMGFERLDDGRLPIITIRRDQAVAAQKWCFMNAKGRYHIAQDSVAFMRISDAVLAKLALD